MNELMKESIYDDIYTREWWEWGWTNSTTSKWKSNLWIFSFFMKLCFQGRVCFFVLLSRKIEQPSRRTASDRQKGSILIFPRFLFFVSFFFCFVFWNVTWVFFRLRGCWNWLKFVEFVEFVEYLFIIIIIIIIIDQIVDSEHQLVDDFLFLLFLFGLLLLYCRSSSSSDSSSSLSPSPYMSASFWKRVPHPFRWSKSCSSSSEAREDKDPAVLPPPS